MTKEQFIEKSREIYGDKYEYNSISNDVNLQPYNNVPIYCNRHGLFFQSVHDHLQGKGCFKCDAENRKII